METVEVQKQFAEYSVKCGYPGEGSLKFVMQITEGMTREEIIEILPKLLDGSYYDSKDKRIKKCAYCGYHWRDDSRNNTKKTCSTECHTAKKSLQKQKQRERKALLEPEQKPKKRKLQEDYVYWLEYPYWINEYSMIKLGWKYEIPHKVETMNSITAKNVIHGKGNKKVKSVNYNESEKEERFNDYGNDEF